MNKIELFFKWAEKNKWEIKKNGKENNRSYLRISKKDIQIFQKSLLNFFLQ